MDKQTINIMSSAMPLVIDQLQGGAYRGRLCKRAYGMYKLDGNIVKRIKLAVSGKG